MLPPPNEDTRVADLQRRVENLETALRAAFTTISGGRGLTIKDGGTLQVLYPDSLGGEIGVFFGNIDNASNGVYQGTGLLVQDADGSDIATFRSDVSGNPIVILRDGSENAVLYTDTVSGQGLGRPYIPFAFYGARFTDTPSVTTSGSFETLWQGLTYKQHQGVFVAAASVADAGSAGEVRVLVNNVPLGTTQAVSATAAGHAFGVDAVAGTHMQSLTVQIQARRTSGSGNLRVFPQIGVGLPA